MPALVGKSTDLQLPMPSSALSDFSVLRPRSLWPSAKHIEGQSRKANGPTLLSCCGSSEGPAEGGAILRICDPRALPSTTATAEVQASPALLHRWRSCSSSAGPNYMPGEGPHGPRYSIGARREAGAGRAELGQHHAERAKPVTAMHWHWQRPAFLA